MNNGWINDSERDAFYKIVHARRDVRSFFKPDPVPSEALARVLRAAHHAGSVGYMQPWNFVVVEDPALRLKVKESFEKEKAEAALLFDEPKQRRYRSFKLEGILEAPVNLIVTCDSSRHGPQVIGRRSMPETDLYSTCLAIQNLWLAARAENLGLGWVSIVKPEDLHAIFGVPREITVVAYLCLGYVSEFPLEPDFERLGWLKRLPLKDLVFFEKWGDAKPSEGREDLPGLLGGEKK